MFDLSQRPPSICFVDPNLGRMFGPNGGSDFAGGAELRQRIIALALAKCGFKVCVATVAGREANTIPVEQIRFEYADEANSGWPVMRFIHPRLTSWWRALRRADSAIYFQTTASFLTLLVGLYCRWRGRPFVYSGAHDLDFESTKTWRLFQRRAGWRDRHMFRLGLRFADAIVAQHPGQAANCRSSYGLEATIIPNCYEYNGASVAKSDGVVLWVATIRSWKRPELFLDLARALPNLRFRMIGGPSQSERELYETVRFNASKIGNLEFLGFAPLKDVERYFDDVRLFVNTSEFEGFPNTFLQSWARGIPTVSFVDCHSRDADGPIGAICDSATDMKRAVIRLTEDNQYWAAEGQRARQYFQSHHSVDRAVAAYSQLFEQLLKVKPATV